MRTISVTNFKGGVGKTTTAVMLAQELAYLGYRVLIMDADPQGHATIMAREERDGAEVVRALERGGHLRSRCLRTRLSGTPSYVLPAGTETATINRHLVMQKEAERLYPSWREALHQPLTKHLEGTAAIERLARSLDATPEEAREGIQNLTDAAGRGFETTLRKLFAEDMLLGRSVGLSEYVRDELIQESFDVCIIDTPPTLTDLLGDIALNVDFYLVTARPEGMSVYSVHQLATYINEAMAIRGVPEHLRPNYVGILLNAVSGTKEERGIIAEFTEAFGAIVLQHQIPFDRYVLRCAAKDPPYPANRGSRVKPASAGMTKATNEIVTRLNLPAPTPGASS